MEADMAINPAVLFEGAPANLAPAQYAQMNAQTALTNQQTKMSMLGAQQTQRAMDEDQAIKAAAQRRMGQDGSMDTTGLLGDITAINPSKGAALGKQMAEQQQLQQKMQAEQFDMQSKLHGVMGNSLASLLTKPELTKADLIEQGNQIATKFPQAKGMLAQAIGSVPDNATDSDIRGMVKRELFETLSSEQKLNQLYGKPMSTPNGIVNVTPASEPGGTPTATSITETDLWGEPKAAMSGGKPVMIQTNKKTGEVREAPGGFAPVPQKSTVQIGMGGSSDFDPSKPLPPALESQAKATAETGVRLTPSSRNPQAWLTNARADYLAQQQGGTVGDSKQTFQSAAKAREYFTTGQGASAIRQQETILHHADVFTQIFDALDNGNVQMANKLGNQFGAQFGSDTMQNAKIAGTILSAEVGKYLAGGQSTEGERSELANLIPTFSSPQQAKGGLQTLKNLVEGQRQSWMKQRDAALKGQVMNSGSSAPSGKVLSLDDYLKSKGF
jgi:hypothetical protein